MSAPVTEAHLELAKTVIFSRDSAGRLLTAPMGAQLIANSEARACAELRAEVATLRKFAEQVTDRNEEMTKLRAEVERLNRDYDYDHKCLHEVRERCELWKQRAERAEAEVERLTAEVGMLRGYDCGAMQEAEDGPTPDGECGVCIKCLRARAERAEASLHALRLVCGTTDANKFSTWVDRAIARAEKAEAELAAERDKVKTLRSATDLLMARANDELKSGRPALIAMQWHRIEPIIAALAATEETK